MNDIQHSNGPDADQVDKDHSQSRNQSSPVPWDAKLSGKRDVDVGGDVKLG